MLPPFTGGPTMQTFGIVSLLASSSAVIGRPLVVRPILRPASIQSFFSAEKNTSSLRKSFGDSVPVLPNSAARAITIGTATSTQDTVKSPKRSEALPVGSALPVFAPTGNASDRFG